MRNKGAGGLVRLAGIGLGMFLVAQGGCGIKADPKPPERVVPASVTDLKAAAEGTETVLNWTVPEKNTNGTPLTDLEGFKIFRAYTGKCPSCPPRFARIAKTQYLYPEGDLSATGRMAYVDKQMDCGSYIYKVRGYNRRGHESSDSNDASITFYVALAPPTGLRVTSNDKKVALDWEPVYPAVIDESPVELAGYNLYRGKVSSKYGKAPVNKARIKANRFIDLEVQNNQKYFYALRALFKIDDRFCEGTLSNEVTAFPEDLTPPDSPGGIFCEQVEDGFLVGWEKNTEPDLQGYNVYRKTEGALAFEKLTPLPQKETTFLDWQISPFTWYIYKVTAVDNAPRKNESEASMACMLQYRKKELECPEGVQCPSE